MPKTKLNHTSSRRLVCLICWYKIFGNGGRILKHGTNLTNLIKSKYSLLKDYDPSDQTLPNAICSNCRLSLNKCESNVELRAPLIKACLYPDSGSAMHTRTCSNASACSICLTARQKYRPSSREPCTCPKCTQYHQLPSTSTASTEHSNKTGPQFTASNLIAIQTKQNLSNNQIINIASSLRSICGRSAVESNFREKLTETSKKLDSFYSSISSNFKISDKDGYGERVLVYCHDVEALVNFILNDTIY